MPRRHRGRSLAHGLLELAILLFGETEVRARTDAPARRAVSCRINPEGGSRAMKFRRRERRWMAERVGFELFRLL
jgi:hypothetical protein